MTITVIFLVAVICVLVSRSLLPHFGSTSPLTRDVIENALKRLGELASVDGHTITLVVVGGAALVLRYNTRASTQDVDAFMETPPERHSTQAWATVVAQELGLQS